MRSKHISQAKRGLLWSLLLVLLALITAQTTHAAPGDMVIPRKQDPASTATMPASIFPHWIHRVRYRCDACHNRLFKMELGATEISMELMRKNKSCATCHNGDKAFKVGFSSCDRCHVSAEKE